MGLLITSEPSQFIYSKPLFLGVAFSCQYFQRSVFKAVPSEQHLPSHGNHTQSTQLLPFCRPQASASYKFPDSVYFKHLLNNAKNNNLFIYILYSVSTRNLFVQIR